MRALSLILALALATPTVLLAQETCDEGRVSDIVVERQNIFAGPDSGQKPGFMDRVYGVGNRIHVTTHEKVIEAELLFQEGDCFDPLLLAESERALRALSFIAEAEVTEEGLPDGSHRVHVRTRDAWSLKISLGISVDQGFTMEGVGASEINLLGRGLTLGIFRDEYRDYLENGYKVGSPRLLGSPWDARVRFGDTRVGAFVDEALLHPFGSEVGRFAARQRYRNRQDYFAYSTSRDHLLSQLLLPYEEVRYEVTAAARLGPPGRLWMIGGGFSYEEVKFPGFPNAVLGVEEDDFANPVSALEEDRLLLASQANPHAATRFNLLLGFRGMRHITLPGLDAVRALQDLEIGSEVLLVLGRSVDAGGEPGMQPADDWYGRVEGSVGLQGGPWVLHIDGLLEGRNVLEAQPGWDRQEGEEGWRDVMAEVEANVYLRPERLESHTFFGRVSAAGAWFMDRPYQLTVGGREAVRGYIQDAFPGGRRLLATVEDRITLDWPRQQLFDLGLAFFADGGKVWAGDVPYGADSGWRSSVGAGLRISSPAGSDRVVRADFTLPLSGDAGAQGTTFRLYGEVLGLLERRDTPSQLDRSRWFSIDPDLVTRPRVK